MSMISIGKRREWDEEHEAELTAETWRDVHESSMMLYGATVGMYAISEYGETKITGTETNPVSGGPRLRFIFEHAAI